jgi:hypothetical protein
MSINMEFTADHYDALLRSGARRLTGHQRRLFQAEVATELCGGSARLAERRFGWARETVEKGLHESHHGMRCLENFSARGRQRSEDKNPQLAAAIRAIVEPHTYADPELQSSRRYTNLSAAEVRTALIEKGHAEAELPSERTLRDILNRMNYRLKRIQKGKPLKKTKETDAIFANVRQVVHPIEDVPQGALAGQGLFGMALGDQGVTHLGRRQVGVPPRRLEFRIGVGVGLDDGVDVGRQSRVLLFAALPAPRGEVLQAAHAVMLFVESLLDRLASPAEAVLGLPGVAAAQCRDHLGLEQAALVSGQPPRPRPNQGIILLNGVFHHSGPARGETVTDQGARIIREDRIAQFEGDFHPPVA